MKASFQFSVHIFQVLTNYICIEGGRFLLWIVVRGLQVAQLTFQAVAL